MSERIIINGDIYRHFKGKLYQVLNIAIHSETSQELVIYQALYGDFKVYARPKEMFLSEVDHEKYPQVKARYRFTKIDRSKLAQIQDNKHSDKSNMTTINNNVIDENKIDIRQEHKIDVELKDEAVIKDESELKDETANEVNPDLMDFLNADSYKEKIEVLNGARNRLDEHILDIMAVTLDYVLPEGEFDEKFSALMQCLSTRERYELRRR